METKAKKVKIKMNDFDDKIALFGRKLVHVDKNIRESGFLALQKYLRNLVEISENDFLKLWKVLLCSFWLCDKVSVQHEFSFQLCFLMRLFKNEQKPKFIFTFYKSIMEEWKNIDKFRMDKYLLLLRMFQSEIFLNLSFDDWNVENIKKINSSLMDCGLIVHRKGLEPKTCLGVLLHYIDTFVDEIERTIKIYFQNFCIDKVNEMCRSGKALTIESPCDLSEKNLKQNITSRRNTNDNLPIHSSNNYINKDSNDHTSYNGFDDKNEECEVLNQKVDSKVFLLLMEPLFLMALYSSDDLILIKIHKKVFLKLNERLIDLTLLCATLFKYASNVTISAKNRKYLFKTISFIERRIKEKSNLNLVYENVLNESKHELQSPVLHTSVFSTNKDSECYSDKINVKEKENKENVRKGKKEKCMHVNKKSVQLTLSRSCRLKRIFFYANQKKRTKLRKIEQKEKLLKILLLILKNKMNRQAKEKKVVNNSDKTHLINKNFSIQKNWTSTTKKRKHNENVINKKEDINSVLNASSNAEFVKSKKPKVSFDLKKNQIKAFNSRLPATSVGLLPSHLAERSVVEKSILKNRVLCI